MDTCRKSLVRLSTAPRLGALIADPRRQRGWRQADLAHQRGAARSERRGFRRSHPCAVTELLVQVAAGDAVGAGVEAHPVDGGEHLSSLTERLPVGTGEPERRAWEMPARPTRNASRKVAPVISCAPGSCSRVIAVAMRTMVPGSLFIQSAMPAYRPWSGCRCGSIAARSSSSPLAVIVDAQGVGVVAALPARDGERSDVLLPRLGEMIGDRGGEAAVPDVGGGHSE